MAPPLFFYHQGPFNPVGPPPPAPPFGPAYAQPGGMPPFGGGFAFPFRPALGGPPQGPPQGGHYHGMPHGPGQPHHGPPPPPGEPATPLGPGPWGFQGPWDQDDGSWFQVPRHRRGDLGHGRGHGHGDDGERRGQFGGRDHDSSYNTSIFQPALGAPYRAEAGDEAGSSSWSDPPELTPKSDTDNATDGNSNDNNNDNNTSEDAVIADADTTAPQQDNTSPATVRGDVPMPAAPKDTANNDRGRTRRRGRRPCPYCSAFLGLACASGGRVNWSGDCSAAEHSPPPPPRCHEADGENMAGDGRRYRCRDGPHGHGRPPPFRGLGPGHGHGHPHHEWRHPDRPGRPGHPGHPGHPGPGGPGNLGGPDGPSGYRFPIPIRPDVPAHVAAVMGPIMLHHPSARDLHEMDRAFFGADASVGSGGDPAATATDSSSSDAFSFPVDVFHRPSAAGGAESGGEGWVVHAALPGARLEDIGIEWDASRGVLSVAGVLHRPGDEVFQAGILVSERPVGLFQREIVLPPQAGDATSVETPAAQIDGAGITAAMDNGVLVVTVPVAEKEWVKLEPEDMN